MIKERVFFQLDKAVEFIRTLQVAGKNWRFLVEDRYDDSGRISTLVILVYYVE